ncbi:SH3 domain-containing protein [Lipomyces tetrasporus]|uniref:SH3 domain-containing protein n=1 Tax=Lipomyces tetrasporus TaxID=54092 RepID=A0AAD7QMR1_9ASCO|nr:SH3 domain-containing protein [Lipomyces tetrasporus]KAJ8097746.1 SH3 domain-containing protein [Lipomyces tetrasporus]
MSDMNAALVNRSLSSIRNELETLKAVGVITPQLFDHISESLPKSYSPGMPPCDLKSTNGIMNDRDFEKTHTPPQTAQQAPPPPQYSPGPQEQLLAEAIYDYRPTDASDLALYRGAQIIILEKINPDWWRGRDKASNTEGIFPSSYVRVVDAFSPPVQSSYGQSYPQQQQYMAPPPQQYAPPSPQPYVAPVQAQAQAGSSNQDQKPHHEGAFEKQGKKFGKKLGNAAIFGAGATIGSNIVNSIF